jgi:hypothetical protein
MIRHIHVPHLRASHVGCPSGIQNCSRQFCEPATRLQLPPCRFNKKNTLKGAFFIKWWRRRELNPRPQIRYRWHYMLSQVFCLMHLAPTDRINLHESSYV